MEEFCHCIFDFRNQQELISKMTIMKTAKKITKTILLLIVGLFVGVFIIGAVNGVKDALKADKSEAIRTTLLKHCDCESINSFIYAKGIQFSKTDGVSNEKAEYELLNCKYENLDQEVERINKLLKSEVEGYEDLDVLKLEYVGKEKHETITIKNGIVQ